MPDYVPLQLGRRASASPEVPQPPLRSSFSPTLTSCSAAAAVLPSGRPAPRCSQGGALPRGLRPCAGEEGAGRARRGSWRGRRAGRVAGGGALVGEGSGLRRRDLRPARSAASSWRLPGAVRDSAERWLLTRARVSAESPRRGSVCACLRAPQTPLCTRACAAAARPVGRLFSLQQNK